MKMFLSHTKLHAGYHEGIYRAKRYSAISVFKSGSGKLVPPTPSLAPKDIDLHSLETILDSGKPLELVKSAENEKNAVCAFFQAKIGLKDFFFYKEKTKN
jgi:hypothetical protein